MQGYPKYIKQGNQRMAGLYGTHELALIRLKGSPDR